MACNTKPGEAWRFYEIDEAVVRIARDPKLFHFLSACRPDADIVLGDARLTVAKEPAAAFDYLLVDAFSSDAIPTHLLTVEALRMFLDKVADRGVLAVHLSNRHLDLPPIVAATLRQIPGATSVLVRYAPANPGYDASPSTVVLISRQASVLEPALSWPGAAPLADAGKAAWTDDYSNILSALSGG
jgi:spermidine synthase